jgi:hypothetical protein
MSELERETVEPEEREPAPDDAGTIADGIAKAVALDGPDADTNVRLDQELRKARSAGMPESMIKRVLAMAISDAGGGGGSVVPPELEPEQEPEPEPEPEPEQEQEPARLDARFEIRVGFGGKPISGSAAAANADPGFDESSSTFYVQVNDDQPGRPRSITIWRLHGSADADDEGVSRAVLHGCSARMCDDATGGGGDGDDDAFPPGCAAAGAFQVRLAKEDEGAVEGSCYYFAPVAHQSASDLVSFFNECGNAPPAEAPDDDTGVAGGLRQTDSSQRMTRAFEAPSPATEPGEEIAPLGVKKAEVIGVEEQADDSGAKVMVYLLRCTALANRQPDGKPSETPPRTWELSKRFADFEALQRQLVQADKASQADTLDLDQVPFPARLSIWSRAEGPEVAAARRPELQTWLNQMIFLNNTLVTSGHWELDAFVVEFLTPQTDAAQQKSDPADVTDGWREVALAQGFVEPTTAEMNAEGEELVGRRVFVCGHRAPGVVTAFHKKQWGSSSHSVTLDGQEETTVIVVKLARKTNTDVEKRPWMVFPLDVAAGATPAEGVPPARSS